MLFSRKGDTTWSERNNVMLLRYTYVTKRNHSSFYYRLREPLFYNQSRLQFKTYFSFNLPNWTETNHLSIRKGLKCHKRFEFILKTWLKTCMKGKGNERWAHVVWNVAGTGRHRCFFERYSIPWAYKNQF